MNSLTPKESRLFGEISKEIRTFYQSAAKHVSQKDFGQRSGAWLPGYRPPFTRQFLQGPLLAAIHFTQRSTHVYNARKGRTVEGEVIADELVEYLRSAGFHLDSAPTEIKESALTKPDQILYFNERPVSVEFLQRLSMCQTFRGGDQKDIVILEIGAGLGTLARTVKLLNPSVRYIIIDLLDTLVLSYGFLRANFPDASSTFVVDKVQLRGLDIKGDFTFIPAELTSDIPPLYIDLVINTNSLWEMQQKVAEQYLYLIQNWLHVKRFYSLNRYLARESSAGWRDETFVASYIPLDPYWEVLRWEYGPKFLNNRLASADEYQTLELYVQRVNPDSVDEGSLRQRSAELLAQAMSMTNFRTYRWHRLMWDSIRLYPCRENVEPYYEFLKASDCREYRYFGRRLASFGVEVDEPYTAPIAKRGLRTWIALKLRGLAKRIQPHDILAGYST